MGPLNTPAGDEQAPSPPLRSLCECYAQWTDLNKTELQRKKFEETHTGRPVSWEVYVNSIDKTEFGITVWGSANRDRQIPEARTGAKCPLTEEPHLLTFEPGERVRIGGKIKEFFLNPMIDASNIVRVA